MSRTPQGGKNTNSLVIRLRRKGHSNYRLFDIVLVLSNASSSGFILERIGFFNPNITERYLVYDSQRLAY
jgi:ribosomal protein S16